MQMSAEQMLSKNTIDELYDIEDDLERSRIKSIFMVRAKAINADMALQSLFKDYDKAREAIDRRYQKIEAANRYEIQLILDSKGNPAETIDNYLRVLREDVYFDQVRYNLLTQSPEIHNEIEIKPWEDVNDSAARNYIEKKYNMYSVQKLDDALRIFFAERSYHPVKDLIENVKWDGIQRIPTLLIKWLKCADDAYTREVTRLIFAGGIHRIYRPGCKFDDVVILIGTKQGEGKSTFVRWLALNDTFFNEVNEFEGQKGIEATRGAWICELSELLALTKTKEVEAVKSFITRSEDVYRQPYDRRVSRFKRQCIFIGTTNKEQFLTDKTGNRRFYPIKINQNGYDLFDHEKEIRDDILQCWAEAKFKYDSGDLKPYADQSILSEIRRRQENAMEDDYMVGMIRNYLERKAEVCVIEIWQNALDNRFTKPTRKDSNDISLVLQSIDGWERSEKAKRTPEYGIQKMWYNKYRTFSLLSDSEGEDKKTDYSLPFEGS